MYDCQLKLCYRGNMDRGKPKIVVRFAPDEIKEIRMFARGAKLTVSEVIRLAWRSYIDEPSDKEKAA